MSGKPDERKKLDEAVDESREYKYGFVTDVETETIPKGIDQGVVREISGKNNEPDFLLEFRLKALSRWEKMRVPQWANLDIPPIDFQDISYYSAPTSWPIRYMETCARSIDPRSAYCHTVYSCERPWRPARFSPDHGNCWMIGPPIFLSR